MRCLAALLLCAIAAAGLPAAADQPEEQTRIGTGRLEIVERDDVTMQARIGDRVIAEDYYVHIERSFDAGARGSAVLSLSNGGNGCAAMYEIVAVDAAGRIDATDRFGTCSDLAEIDGNADAITVRFAPVAGLDGRLYRWTAARGLAAPETLPFAAKPGTGWADAGELVGQHPSTLFDNAEISAALKTLLGGDYPLLIDRLLVAENMQRVGAKLIVGTGCMAHACNTDAAFVGLDPAKRLVYVAIQQDGKAARLYPAAAKWPSALRARRKAWHDGQ